MLKAGALTHDNRYNMGCKEIIQTALQSLSLSSAIQAISIAQALAQGLRSASGFILIYNICAILG